jgi:hypothetical protein
METDMNELLAKALEAHGGIERWKELTVVQATIVSGGDLFAIKGVPQDPAPHGPGKVLGAVQGWIRRS